MSLKPNCSLCGSIKTKSIYTTNALPIFQNKVYATEALAKSALTAPINLKLCAHCGHIFNASFDPTQMIYDVTYDNEQAHSPVFRQHLSKVMDIFLNQFSIHDKILEVGCGKGYFLEMLTDHQFEVIGFDPAYTGNNLNIVKSYFNEQHKDLSIDVIVLRHVLEHIQHPFEFLHQIGKAVHYNAKIFIEVPCIEWITKNHCFWDVFYEHCNYFSINSLSHLFHQSTSGKLFDGQYLYLIANYSDLKSKIDRNDMPHINPDRFNDLTHLLNRYHQTYATDSGTVIWGAGAKGVTFANLVDPDKNIFIGLIDINPKKQDHYVAKTAHPILSPDILKTRKIHTVLVMNENYREEIINDIYPLPIKVKPLG